ncbi:MAG: hypothetical protein ACYSUK_02360 [Planctomycetota bacterium]
MSDGQIFKLFGLVYLAVGSGILVNPEYYKNLFQEFAEKCCVMYLSGIMSLSIGFLLVTFHNIWAWEWSVILTIIGWLALIKGLVILVRPKAMMSMIEALTTERLFKVMPICTIMLGLIFLILGFSVV